MPRHTFGVSIEPSWDLNYCISFAKLAEKLGFDNIWVPDGGPAAPFSDTIVTLAGIATNTKRIKFGSAVLNFYTRNPALIASSFLALSNLGFASKRQRAILGIGVGSSYNVGKLGITNRKNTIDQLREAIESISELFEGKEVSVRTDAFAIERVTLSKSKTKIPIYIGTASRKGLRLAGAIADGVILTDRIPSRIEESLSKISLGLSDSSRTRKRIDVVNSVVVSVSNDRAKARNAARTTCAYLVSWLDDDTALRHNFDQTARKKISEFIMAGDEKAATKLVDNQMLDLLTVSGTPEECIEKCREHFDYGADQIAFCEPFGPNPLKALTQIARNVIPKL
jgi:5,10-methylenetetrahydromethanopterin reductase